MKNRTIDSLYILKALAMIFVLLIHFKLAGKQYIEPILRTGVPIFFVISGYFLYSSSKEKLKQKIYKSIKKIILLIIFFQTIYAVFNIHINISQYEFNNFSFWMRLIVYGDNIAGHLWFLNSYLWALVFFLLCVYIGVLSTSFYISVFVIFLIICFSFGQYKPILGLMFDYKDFYIPYIFLSVPLFIAGFLCRKYENKLCDVIGKKIIFLLLVSIILSYTEHRILSYLSIYSGNVMISTCILTIVLLMTSLIYKKYFQSRYRYLVNLGQYHSANIYYWQFIPSYFVVKMLDNSLLADYNFIFVFFVLLLWSYFINKITNYIKK